MHASRTAGIFVEVYDEVPGANAKRIVEGVDIADVLPIGVVDAGLIGGDALERDLTHGVLLVDGCDGAERGREPRGERAATECNEVVVEVLALGDEDKGGDTSPRAAPGEACGRPLPFRVAGYGGDR